MADRDLIVSSHEQLLMAIQNESRKFQEYYVWLEKAMPQSFFEEVSQENTMLISHSLMGFHLQEYFSTIHLKKAAIVLCLNSADADLRILENYSMYGIKNYQAYISNTPPPFPGIKSNLRIAIMYFTEAIETLETPFSTESKEELKGLVKERNPDLTNDDFEKLILGINTRFLKSLPLDRLILAIEMFFRAKTRDNCQYEVRYDEDWELSSSASMQIVLAWRNTPKHNFLYRMARMIHRHGLVMKRVNATYVNPYSKQNILIMALWLHGSNGKAAWDVADIPDFLRELATVKYFPGEDYIDQILVNKGIVTGNQGNLLRTMNHFIHQSLVHLDPNLYTLENIEDGLCRHPDLTVQVCEAFKRKFDPDHLDLEKYNKIRTAFINDVNKLDTGQEDNDLRRKNILYMAMNMVHYTLKTNYYRMNYTALSFRLDPKYLDEIPFDRAAKFPELPYAIFFIRGIHFFGFHIRFKDLARGGVRTVYPEQHEAMVRERNTVFSECYNLALTQHKKNKDIPEGGSKGIIFLLPYSRLESETLILRNELEISKIHPDEIEAKIITFRQEQKIEYLHQAQRSFIESLITIVNCDPDGTIRAKYIVDYWKKPEYIYLGPDENMHDDMIEWIADFSKKYDYKPGGAFITSKPKVGINHKEYGVTSLGVNVYAEMLLKSIDIDPTKEPFTVKMSGGPDGDVAGNQILNLYNFYPKTAKLVAITDISGTIHDPEGLDLKELVSLFKQGLPLKYYPPQKLHEGGFLLDKNAKRMETSYVQQTLCWRHKDRILLEDWLSGSDMNHLLRNNVHQTKADLFIPAGGRPRTLNETNIKDFLDESGKPTSKAIVEGANLYISPKARHMLEKLGVLIIKDSSANKTGVICSSFEVLCGLTLSEEKFLSNKNQLVNEILERLQLCARNEADLLLRTHKMTGDFLTDISDTISERINQFTYQLLDYLDTMTLSNDSEDPLQKTFLNYCLPTLRNHYRDLLITQIPEHHKKAIIACHIAASLVYRKGLNWLPTIVDIFPILLKDKEIENE
jgi:glutamate dehydrogenase